MKQEELNEIIQKHEQYLNSGGGKYADLSGQDLSGLDLRRADLRFVNLSGADLRGSNLERVNLSDANLRIANFQDANLRGANLRGINLQDANLEGVDLDFSCMPLWCGDLECNYDDKQIIQQLYHVLSHVKYSNNCSQELKDILMSIENLKIANKFHRVKECGELKKGDNE